MNNRTKLSAGGIDITSQISKLGVIPINGFEPNFTFLIKNNTDSNLLVNIKLANNEEYIITTIYPGWNPEICSGINYLGSLGDLQFGY